MKPETEIGDRGLEHGVSYEVRGRVKRRYAQILGEENWSIQWTQLEGSEEASSTSHDHGDARQEYQDLPRTEGVIPHHRI